MPNFIDLTGKKLNKLTVTDEKELKLASGRMRWFWKCVCDCGKITFVHSSSLLSGHTKSCGCLLGYNVKLPDGEAAINIYFRNYKDGAKRRKLKWKLTREQFIKLVTKNCYYCNAEPSDIKAVRRKENLHGYKKFNGIDRLLNNIDYLLYNCVPCCKDCNYMKRQLNVNDFIKKCSIISKRLT